MSTSMHRLQISLPRSQMQFLAERSRRDGVSIAEIIRRLVQHEAEVAPARRMDSLFQIIGIGSDREPLLNDIPVSEKPDLYLAEAHLSYRKAVEKNARQRGRPRRR